MKKTDEEKAKGCLILILIILAIILIEVFGDYCNSHKEEIRQRDWEKFESWHNEIMTTGGNINWDAKD